MTAARSVKADTVGVEAVDAAREALLELVERRRRRRDTSATCAEDERVTTHYFACTRAGYRGWRWAVTVARAPRLKAVTVDEVVLLPGDDAITAPAWVPYRDRIQPGDLSPGDLLPTEEDDPRLVPGYLSGDPGDDIVDQDSVREVVDELGLGRARVLSLEGRDLAAERWYDGSHGPELPLAQSAPARARPAGSWSGWPGRWPRCSGSARTRTPTTTAAWSRWTTAAARTPRRSWPRGACRSRCPTRCSTPCRGTSSRQF